MSTRNSPVASAPRPSIPVAVWCAVSVWTGSLLAESISWRAYVAGDWRTAAAGVGGGMFALLLAAVLGARRRTRAALILAMLGGSLLVGSVAWGCWRAEARALGGAGCRTWQAVVADDPVVGQYGPQVTARLAGPVGAGSLVQLSWPADGAPPPRGTLVGFRCVLTRTSADELGRVAARRGVVARGRAREVRDQGFPRTPAGLLASWRKDVLWACAACPGDGGALLSAVVAGDRRRLQGSAIERDMRVAGLGHVAAASAVYVALVCAGVLALARRLGVPRGGQFAAALLAAVLFACAAGLTPSMLRGLVVAGLGGAAWAAGRRRDALAGAGIAACAVILAGPNAVFDVGFQLGVLSVAGIGLFGELSAAWAGGAAPHSLEKWARRSATVVAAQAGMFPVSTTVFGMVPMLAPVTNLAAVPLVTGGLWLGLCGACVRGFSPAGGDVLLRCAASTFGAVAGLAGGVATVPRAALPVPSESIGFAVGAAVVVAASLWVAWPLPAGRRQARAVMLAGALAIAVVVAGRPGGSGTRVTVMDIGQGDAILVRDGSASMLVDTGPDEAALRKALGRQGVSRLDCVVLTHIHADHVGGLGGLVGVASVGWVGEPAVADEAPWASVGRTVQLLSPPRRDRVRTLRAGDTWVLGGTTVRVLWPERPDASLSANDTSVVLLLTKGQWSALLTGDAEQRPQAAILGSWDRGTLDVLKEAHHGSVNGLFVPGLEAWRPREALISVGAGNRFGHPAPSTLRALVDAGADVHRTDLEGDLEVRAGENGCTTARRRRGATAAACARIGKVPGFAGAVTLDSFGMEDHGCSEPRGSEARLPHLRRRGALTRARGPPASRPRRGGGGPRLQLRRIRR